MPGSSGQRLLCLRRSRPSASDPTDRVNRLEVVDATPSRGAYNGWVAYPTPGTRLVGPSAVCRVRPEPDAGMAWSVLADRETLRVCRSMAGGGWRMRRA